MKKKLVMACAAAFVLSIGGIASAGEGEEYVTRSQTDGYSVDFIDDLLDGVGLDGGGPMIVQRSRPLRITLIRPRTSFVNEMLKSVENI